MAKRAKTKSAKADDRDYWEPLPRIAELLLMSEERVRQFVKMGLFERRDDGRLNLRLCLHMYALFLRDPSWFRG